MRTGRAILLLLAASLCAACEPGERDPIQILDPYSLSTPPGSTVGGAYMTVRSRDGDVLLGGSTPIAARVEMHVTERRDGMMSMRPLPEVRIAPGESFSFAAGGAHFMLMELREPLRAGSSFMMTLHFKAAGNVTTSVRVLEPGAAPNP